MGYAKYFEDISGKLDQSFYALDQLSIEHATGKSINSEDIRYLLGELSNIKCEAKSLLRILEKRVTRLLGDPDFNLLGELQQAQFDKAKFEASASYLSGQIEIYRQDTERMEKQLELTLSESKYKIAEAEEIALANIAKAEEVRQQLKGLQKEVVRLQLEAVSNQREIHYLRTHNEKLQYALEKAKQHTASSMGKRSNKRK